MKKIPFLFPFLLLSFLLSQGQNFTVGLDRMNDLYVGVDNPISVAVSDISIKSVVVTTDLGSITGTNGKYIFSSSKPGTAHIYVSKKNGSKLITIGYYPFRVKRIPNPIFKIGANLDKMSKNELLAQQFVRAELENFDFDALFLVDSFKVCIFFTDSCHYIERKNKSNKLCEEILNDFKLLKNNDIVIFKDIFVHGMDSKRELNTKLITIVE